jgi:hypothetical protein
MTNKLLLSTLIASSFFIAAQANAVDGTGTANFNLVAPITVSEKVQMELGDITILEDGFCTIDTAGTLTGGNCVLGGNAPFAGKFEVEAANSDVTLTLSDPIVDTGFTFTPLLQNGTKTDTVTVTGNLATVFVGGRVDVTKATATAAAKSLSYTLSVVYL